MQLLRNFDIANKYFDLDDGTEKEYASEVPISGWYKFIDHSLSGLLVRDYELYFLFGREQYLVTDDFNAGLIHQPESFVLFDGVLEVARLPYESVESTVSPAPFEYIDKEDSSWTLFLQKVINDKLRRNNLIRNLMAP